MSIRTGTAIALALGSPFFFPAPLSAAIVLVASVIVPPVGLLAGILTDALYRAPGMLPYATLAGALASVLGYVVQRIIKTRIIGA